MFSTDRARQGARSSRSSSTFVALVGSGEELLGNEHVRRAYLGL